MSSHPVSLQKSRVRMADGRVVNYYDVVDPRQPSEMALEHEGMACSAPPGPARVLERPSEMRWHPLMGEWVVYAAHRMNRPQLPTRDACPLCPGPVELHRPYEIAIFENKAPAMCYVPGEWHLPPTEKAFELTAPARGRCDLTVYCQEHEGKFAWLPLERVYALVEAWRDRYAELMNEPEIQFVSIFENKGREAGMTLDHPHGQIYAFPFLPPHLQRQLERTLQFRERGEDVWQRVIEKELREKTRVIAETEGFLAAVPFYARHPYEVHIWAKRAGVASLLDMVPQERRELAGVMQNVAQRHENLWENAAYGFPTLMLMQQLSGAPLTSIGGAESYRFHIEIYPLQRSAEKMKYRASIEVGAGTALNDALPENQAAELRAVAPQQVALPDVTFV